MKILLISDTESKYIWDFFDKERLGDVDLILSAGDVKASFLSYLVDMIPAPLYYVPGNHDTSFVTTPPEGCISIDDQVIEYNGLVIAGLGGSIRYNESKSYQYTEAEMHKRVKRLERQLKKHPKIDIFLTHAPALGLGDGDDLCHRGFQTFRQFINQHQPRYFLHGHQHLNYGRVKRKIRYGLTTIINCYDYYLLEL